MKYVKLIGWVIAWGILMTLGVAASGWLGGKIGEAIADITIG